MKAELVSGLSFSNVSGADGRLAGALLTCALMLGSATHGHAEPYSPWADRDYPQQVYWGDTHLHTAASLDANLFGVHNLTAAEAYRFARGETITTSTGLRARMNRPLDFLVVADHAEYLGVMPPIRAGDPTLMQNETARRWRDILSSGDSAAFGRMMVEIGSSYASGTPLVTLPTPLASPWEANTRMADEANEPGVFSALIGFEWSSMPDGNNLHRVVVLRDSAERANQVRPFSVFDSEDPQALWHYLAAYEQNTGGQALAIPHNSNLSGGQMFADMGADGEPIGAAYARERLRWEPLVEVTQIKGDSEAHPQLSPNDEFADYGTWDKFNIGMRTAQEDWMQRFQYVRPALQTGLQVEQRTGVNPFQFGMIGSTDSHTALAAVEEDNFWGKMAIHEPSAQRASGNWGTPENEMSNTELLSAGYAAVWATENTREALFDAMRRREVYATTGPRMTVRFFGGWDYTQQDLQAPDSALQGYLKGVPMGAVLPPREGPARAPVFMASALKEPGGAHLDRLQIIKGWVDSSGASRESVHDVAWSGARQPDAQGTLPAVGNTVDTASGHYRNTIGSAELSAVWADPDFDATQGAVYYLRVLEIPTPRWPVHDRARLHADIPSSAALTHQERAYTSPIWYQPAATTAP